MSSNKTWREEDGMFLEPEKKIPVVAEAQVVVVGGGPSGIGAALSASRNGADTILIDQFGSLGGAQTQGLNPIFSFVDPEIHGGIMQEILKNLAEGGALKNLKDLPETEWNRMKLRIRASVSEKKIPKRIRDTSVGYWGEWGRIFDLEYYKYLLENMMREARVKLLYHSFAVGAIRENNSLKGIIIECKEGRQAVLGKVIIDTTGQGDIAWKSGAPCVGEEERSAEPPYVSNPGGALNANFIGGVDIDRFLKFKEENPKEWGEMYGGRELIRQAREEGYPGLERDTAILSVHHDVYNSGRVWVMYPLSIYDRIDRSYTENLTDLQISLRKQMWSLHKLLKDKVPGFERSYIENTSHIPVGLGGAWHRMAGDYVLRVEDMREGKSFDDSVCIANMPPDLYEATGSFNYDILPHDIPYRSLVSREIDNLLAAGASMSSGNAAMAGTRYCSPSICTGQAAGTAAALAAKSNLSPKKLDIKRLQDRLRNQGVRVTVREVAEESLEPYRFIKNLSIEYRKS